MTKSLNPSVRIRMYRQGLGDCFLLTFSESNMPDFNMIIDCGLLQGTSNAKSIMNKVAEDISAALTLEKEIDGVNKKWLDVVVLTHEHADHISGFNQAKDVFENIHFGEVWVGWMEDESHPNYKAVRERFHKQADGLKAALARMNSNEQKGLKEAIGLMLDEFFDPNLLGATGTGGRSAAWDFALKKSVADPRFLTPGTTFPLADFGDIRIYILGPSEDFESFTRVNPPEDDTYRSEGAGFALSDSFFAAAAANDTISAESFQPFEKRLRIARLAAPSDQFFQAHYGFAPTGPEAWRRIDDDWLSVASVFALRLDSYTNNTCLAFAIEFVSSGKVLLFPGDAQFSNWLSWQKLSWQMLDGQGGKVKVTTKDLLERTVFYKVGHHGSHNATLKKHGLEMMTNPELVAMIPVDREKAKSQTSKTNPNGWEMPERNLFDRLMQRTRGRIVIADEKDGSELKKRCKDKAFLSNVQFDGSFVRDETISEADEPLYVELTING